MNERWLPRVDSSPVTAHGYDDRADMLGGGLLSDRLRASQDGYVALQDEPVERPAGPDVVLGAAAQLEIDGGEVQFLVPFRGAWPNEYWLQAFRQAQGTWPSHLVGPRVDEGRGLRLGPLPAAQLEEHVRAVKDLVAAANRIYADEIEPQLRREREEAERREHEAERLQAEVESKLKLLLG